MRADRTTRSPRPTGFTLVELLVVIAIIAMLATLGGYGIMRGRRSANVSASQAMLKSIEMGLEQFKNDTGDYPISYASTGPVPICRNPATAVDRWTGAQWLAQGMLGLADEDPAGNPNADGAPGAGFRLIRRGRVYGPYIDAENTETRLINGIPVMLDSFGNPMLYYRFDETNGRYWGRHNDLDDPNEALDLDDAIEGPGGPSADTDINAYAKRGGDNFVRRDYLICSQGPDGLWYSTIQTGGGWSSDDDDLTNME
ncbi:MAG: type II secretion system protein [Planctomycetota bacterium]